MKYNLLYVLFVSLLLGGYISYTSNIYITVFLIFFIVKIIQIELLNSSGRVSALVERNIPLYFFVGDFFLGLHLLGNDLLTWHFLILSIAVNSYIYLSFFSNLKLYKGMAGMVFDDEARRLFQRETNPVIMLVYFPIYFYLLMNWGDSSVEVVGKILGYSFYLLAFVMFVDFGLGLKRKKIMEEGFSLNDKKYLFEVRDISDIELLEAAQGLLKNVQTEVLILFSNRFYAEMGLLPGYSHVYSDLQRYLEQQPTEILNRQIFFALNDRKYDFGKRVRSAYFSSKLCLDKENPESLVGDYDQIFVLGEYSKELFMKAGYPEECVTVVGTYLSFDSSGGKKGKSVSYILDGGSFEDFKNAKGFIMKNLQKIYSGDFSLQVDFSDINVDYFSENPDLLSLKEEIKKVNKEVESMEMDKAVSFGDLLTREGLSSYNGNKIKIINRASPLEKRLNGVDVAVLNNSCNLWKVLSSNVYCVLNHGCLSSGLGWEGVFGTNGSFDMSLDLFKGGCCVPNRFLLPNKGLYLEDLVGFVK